MVNKDYEDEYHQKVHTYLYNDPKYYILKSKLAYITYFKNLDLKGKKILEFGCGLGPNIYYLNKLGLDIIGYDISNFALDFCRKKGLKVTNNFNILKQFDIIFSRHVLEHIKNPFNILIQINKKLKKGGSLILILPYEKHKKVKFETDINNHLYAWNFRTINNLLNETGYKVIENKVLPFASGYKIFSFSDKISTRLYNFLTKMKGRLTLDKELKIVAIKP